RLVAVLRGGLPAGTRAGPGARGCGGGGGSVRVRAVPRDRGRAPARDLLGRHPAGAVPAGAWLPAGEPRARARRLAGVGVAGQPGLHAGPAVRVSDRPTGAARAVALVAHTLAGGHEHTARAPRGDRDVRRTRARGWRRGLRGASVRDGRARLPDRETHDPGSQNLLRGPGRAPW